MEQISALGAADARALSAGQVIVDLRSAVKELVENSLDSGAMRIEVLFRGHGLEGVEVSDDGCGILRGDFSNLGKRSCTSKLCQFADLASVLTLGFRGEALNSLCAIAKVEVTSRTAADEAGVRAELLPGGGVPFDDCGLPVVEDVARGVGTTVRVSAMFEKLPVRRQEFLRNAKREVARAVSVLTGYVFACPAVEFLVRSASGDATNELLVARGKGGLDNRVAAVLGSRQFRGLQPFSFSIAVGGLCGPQSGASTTAPGAAERGDVGASDVPANDGCCLDRFAELPLDVEGYISRLTSGTSKEGTFFVSLNGRPIDWPRLSRTINDSFRKACVGMTTYPIAVVSLRLPSSWVDVSVTPDKRTVFIQKEHMLLEKLRASFDNFFRAGRAVFETALSASNERSPTAHVSNNGGGAGRLLVPAQSLEAFGFREVPPTRVRSPTSSGLSPRSSVVETRSSLRGCEKVGGTMNAICLARGFPAPLARPADAVVALNCAELGMRVGLRARLAFEPEPQREPSGCGLRGPEDEAESLFPDGSSKGYEVSLLDYVKREERPKELRQLQESRGATEILQRSATFAQSLRLQREDFKGMDVVGQFNAGFIIARLGSHLFVIDQHAADEKFRYEQLSRELCIACQPLAASHQLHLTAAEELAVQENFAVLRRFGFKVAVVPDAPPMHRMVLLATGSLGRLTFDAKDLKELVDSLVQSPGVRPCLKKVHALLASRACRSAVMIGTSLALQRMQTIVQNLAQLEHPFACPHGRPSVRHLATVQPHARAALDSPQATPVSSQ